MENGDEVMKRVCSHKQLELIRQRAFGLGLETRNSVSGDFGAAVSVRPGCDPSGSITYYEFADRLTTTQIWGDLAHVVAELEALHALLTYGEEFAALAAPGVS
jgi:hypothetical protein